MFQRSASPPYPPPSPPCPHPVAPPAAALHEDALAGKGCAWPEEDLLRVLCHRADVAASQYLKLKYKLSKGITQWEEKRVGLIDSFGFFRGWNGAMP